MGGCHSTTMPYIRTLFVASTPPVVCRRTKRITLYNNRCTCWDRYPKTRYLPPTNWARAPFLRHQHFRGKLLKKPRNNKLPALFRHTTTLAALSSQVSMMKALPLKYKRCLHWLKYLYKTTTSSQMMNTIISKEMHCYE